MRQLRRQTASQRPEVNLQLWDITGQEDFENIHVFFFSSFFFVFFFASFVPFLKLFSATSAFDSLSPTVHPSCAPLTSPAHR
jgi:hypothetical protein